MPLGKKNVTRIAKKEIDFCTNKKKTRHKFLINTVLISIIIIFASGKNLLRYGTVLNFETLKTGSIHPRMVVA